MPSPVDILLVDDEPRNLDALEAILTDPQYRLLRAQDADAALHLLLQHDVAAIVLDIQMPGVSGFDLAQTIKRTRRFRETPIVFLTAYMVDTQDVLLGYGAGAVDYLTKPFNPQILRQKIAVFAELFRKTRALSELNEKLEDRVRERTAELERSEAALRGALRMRDEFLSIASHELNTPLTAMQLHLEGLARLLASADDSQIVAMVERVRDRLAKGIVGARRLSRLVEELLDISRITTGRLSLIREDFDLAEAVSDVVEHFAEPATCQGSTIHLQVESVVGCWDRTRIEQVVANLLSNALKYGAGKPIAVTVARRADAAVLVVKDDGIGIAAEDQRRIFERFHRAVSQRHYGGFGVGLWIVRQVVEAFGGEILVESEAGKGATFTVRLPLAAPGRADAERHAELEAEPVSMP